MPGKKCLKSGTQIASTQDEPGKETRASSVAGPGHLSGGSRLLPEVPPRKAEHSEQQMPSSVTPVALQACSGCSHRVRSSMAAETPLSASPSGPSCHICATTQPPPTSATYSGKVLLTGHNALVKEATLSPSAGNKRDMRGKVSRLDNATRIAAQRHSSILRDTGTKLKGLLWTCRHLPQVPTIIVQCNMLWANFSLCTREKAQNGYTLGLGISVAH